MPAVIQLQNITRCYQMGATELKVLKGVSLEIREGEFVAIMGPSGSGKSTLLQILGLLDRPSGGSYLLLGHDVSRLSDDEGAALRLRTIGFIFQMFNLLARTSALENVVLPMIYAGAPNRAERAKKLLDGVGMGDRLGHRPNELSGGQQQRVAIARALVNNPRILFADEPTGNLASDQAEEILDLIKKMNASGITVIMVTHDQEIANHAKRIIRLKDGVIVADEILQPVPGASSAPAEPNGTAWNLRPTRLTLVEIKEFCVSAMRALVANKVRSILSVLGILIGVAAVIAMLALGQGAQKAIESRIASLGSNLIMLSPGPPSVGGVRSAEGAVSRITLEDVQAIAAANPHIVRVDGNAAGSAQVVYGSNNVNTSIVGATPLYAVMRNAQPYTGRFFTEAEDKALARVALLGQTVVNNLYGDADPVGTTININRENFKVIGVLPIKGSQGFRDQDDMVLIPLDTAMKRLLGDRYLHNIAIECDASESIPEVMETLRELMRRRHRLPAYKEDDFRLRNMAEIQNTLSGTTKTFTWLLGIVSAISLLVGGIGIMNIMLVSVSERTREIGLQKAVGASRRAILYQFLLESVVLSVLGGGIGVLLGILISVVLSKIAGWAAIVTAPAITLAFVFSASVGILFGFWPARKASLLSPIEALRYE